MNTPTKAGLPRSHKPVQFSCGEEHCSLITEDGQVWTWGYGNDGQLGHGTKNSLSTPKHIKMSEKFVASDCGGGHTGFISEKGDLWACGRGRDGQLGRGEEVESMAAYRPEPNLVSYFSKRTMKVKDLAYGSNHSIGLVSMK